MSGAARVPLRERALRRLSTTVRRSPVARRWIAREFHRMVYEDEHARWEGTHWQGAGLFKHPVDLWQYQQIIAEQRPDLVVETGTLRGGSALFFAHLLDLAGRGRVITIDVDPGPPEGRPEHPRIAYVRGSSVDPAIVARVREAAGGAERVLVSLDADHSAAHVAAELEAYAPLVTPGSYLVVEDTNVNGHPVFNDHGPGPHEAVEAFLAEHPEFARDPAREPFLISFAPGGWLRRVA